MKAKPKVYGKRIERPPDYAARASIAVQLAHIEGRIKMGWQSARLFWENRDAHGVMDMGAELQSLERAKKELEALGKML